jgi:hypothetical protein
VSYEGQTPCPASRDTRAFAAYGCRLKCHHNYSKELIRLKTRLYTYIAVAGCSMIIGAALLAQQQPATAI